MDFSKRNFLQLYCNYNCLNSSVNCLAHGQKSLCLLFFLRYEHTSVSRRCNEFVNLEIAVNRNGGGLVNSNFHMLERYAGNVFPVSFGLEEPLLSTLQALKF